MTHLLFNWASHFSQDYQRNQRAQVKFRTEWSIKMDFLWMTRHACLKDEEFALLYLIEQKANERYPTYLTVKSFYNWIFFFSSEMSFRKASLITFLNIRSVYAMKEYWILSFMWKTKLEKKKIFLWWSTGSIHANNHTLALSIHNASFILVLCLIHKRQINSIVFQAQWKITPKSSVAITLDTLTDGCGW